MAVISSYLDKKKVPASQPAAILSISKQNHHCKRSEVPLGIKKDQGGLGYMDLV